MISQCFTVTFDMRAGLDIQRGLIIFPATLHSIALTIFITKLNAGMLHIDRRWMRDCKTLYVLYDEVLRLA